MFMVSWRAGWSHCGNKTLATRDDLDRFVAENSGNWLSHSLWAYGESRHGVTELVPL